METIQFGTFTSQAKLEDELARVHSELYDTKYELMQATTALSTRDEIHQSVMNQLMSTCSTAQHTMRLRLAEYEVYAEEAQKTIVRLTDALAPKEQRDASTDAALDDSRLDEAFETIRRLEALRDAKPTTMAVDDPRLCEANETIRRMEVEREKLLGLHRSARAEADKLGAKVKSARSDVAILRKNLEEEVLLAKEPRARVVVLTGEKNALEAKTLRLEAETQSLKGVIEQLMRSNQTMGVDYLSLLPLKPAAAAMYDYIQNKMLAIRDAPDASEAKALVDEYFQGEEMQEYVKSRVGQAAKGIPSYGTIVSDVLTEISNRS